MKKAVKYLAFFLFFIFLYYQIDYKRYFVCSTDGTKSFTIWKRYGHHSYIIPGKYFSPFEPTSNYIYARNQYIGIVFNTFDKYEYKISLYPKKISDDFDEKIKIYNNNDDLLIEYNILKKSKSTAIREYAKNRKELRKEHDYRLITLKTIWGINTLIKE